MQRNILIALAIIIPVLISGYITYVLLNKPKTVSPVKTSQLPVAAPKQPVATIDGLNFPPAGAPAGDVDRFYREAVEKAQSASSITLSSCNPAPIITKIAPNQKIIMKNTDSRERLITISPESTYTIPARGETTVVVNSAKGSGIYSYRCDNSSDIVGALAVTQQ